jgi:hypothetical protein
MPATSARLANLAKCNQCSPGRPWDEAPPRTTTHPLQLTAGAGPPRPTICANVKRLGPPRAVPTSAKRD